ncbi:MAG: glutamate racemase [Candidatus Cryptobacteroides sp.]
MAEVSENEFARDYVIGVFDSGVGGLSVLKELKKSLPSASFVYYADTAHCPYGEKTPEYVLDRARTITEILMAQGANVIVIACNTATSAAIASLRKEYPVPFVGMEPAVKPAARITRTGVVGVLATAGTLHGSKYLDIKEKFAEDVRIVESVGYGFVELVEHSHLADDCHRDCLFLSSALDSRSEPGMTFPPASPAKPAPSYIDGIPDLIGHPVLSDPQTLATIDRSLRPLIEEGADTIVLGCTHYPFLLPALHKVAAALLKEHPLQARDGAAITEINFIDPAPAVAHRLLQVLQNSINK